MSMKHPGRYHQKAAKKRRELVQQKKAARRALRERLDGERQGSAKPAAKAK